MIRLSTGSAAVWLFVLVLTFSGAEETLSKDKGESKGSAPLSPLAEFSRWLRKRGINDQKVCLNAVTVDAAIDNSIAAVSYVARPGRDRGNW
eukprot:1924465-Rhodomonas_salina.1